jgi:nitrogen regulatory protein P-II 2
MTPTDPTPPGSDTPDSTPPGPDEGKMILVTIITERLLRDRILAGIHAAGARGHTLTDVTGEGTRRIAAHEWEGPSVKVETIVTAPVAERIREFVADRFFQHHSVIVYSQPVQVMRTHRF